MRHLRFGIASIAIIGFVAWLLLWGPGGTLRARQAEGVASGEKAVILYDGLPDQHSEAYIHALFLENLLTHFELHADLIPITAYKRGQLADYRAGFLIVSTPDPQIPPAVLADVQVTDRPFAWMGGHIDQLLENPQARRRLGFSFVEHRTDLDYRHVLYKQTLLLKPETDLNIVAINNPKVAQVVATAINPKKVSSPYVVRSGNFWYFADRPLSYMAEGTRYLVVCDLLHDILGIDHPASMRAMVRIEDVSVDDDPDDLIKIADLLAGRHIPFSIAIIPIFRDPKHSLEIRLGDRRVTVAAIQAMVARGGTPVMHGTTHQVHGLSGDEYEFWDELGDRPVGGDSVEFVRRRLRQGLAEFFSNGIYPVAYEVPHYAASEIDYRTLAQTFSLFYDRPMVVPDSTTQQLVPYPVVDNYGRHIVPETLGYLPEDDPDPERVIQYARTMRVVRDGVASFYFHPFLNPKLLERAVQGISDLGFHFVSLREFGGVVDFDGLYAVRTDSGPLDVSPQNEYWRLQLFDAGGRLQKTEFSPTPLNGPVDLDVHVPQGGWAAVDCPRQIPREPERAASWMDRLREWWSSAPPPPSAPSTVVRDKFSGPPNAWLLWLDKPSPSAGFNQESYKTVLEALGYQVQLVKSTKFTAPPRAKDVLLVVPHAVGARLPEAQQKQIARFLMTGGEVLADRQQPWLTKAGFAFPGGQLAVSSVSDSNHGDMKLTWRPEEHIARFTPPEDARELMTDTESGQPLAVSGSVGAGHYLYLAAAFDNHTKDGTSHYPYFPEYLSTTFGVSTPLRNSRLDVYFDPSYRPGADYNRLATIWRRSGISTIQVAAWMFTRQWAFPYEEFIRDCHRNGISVYAWFVLPMVTQRMWDEHPEWREKTASGADGNVEWRLSMNLQDPECFRAAMDWMTDLLRACDWDGVNIAELNFDADFKDYLRPDKFIPMNDIVRADFKKKAGFDPIQLFRPGSRHYYKTDPAALAAFQQYREDLVIDWHRRVLGEIEPLAKQHGWEVIVTALDSLHDNYVKAALGVDSRRLVSLMKEFPFTLQIEDPARFWMAPPDRYLRFAASYRKLIPDPRRLMFDVNVVPNRDIRGTFLPSLTATGTELALTVASAASVAGRVAVYSEHTVPPQDWDLIQLVLSHPASITAESNGVEVNTRTSLLLTPADDPLYYVDGRLWPAFSADGVVVPTGRHSISPKQEWWHFLHTDEFQARIVNCSADLLDAQADATDLTFHYWSPGRAVITFDQQPRDILVDGAPVTLPTERDTRNWAVVFPSGDHHVLVITNTKAGVAVDVVGWASSWAIGAFGILVTALMVIVYLHLRLERLIKRNG